MWKDIFWPLDQPAFFPQRAAASPSEWLPSCSTLHLTPNVYETLPILLRALLTWAFVIFSCLSANSSTCVSAGQTGYVPGKKYGVMTLLLALFSERDLRDCCSRYWRKKHPVPYWRNQVLSVNLEVNHQVTVLLVDKLIPATGNKLNRGSASEDCAKESKAFREEVIGRKPWESGCELFTSGTFLAKETVNAHQHQAPVGLAGTGPRLTSKRLARTMARAQDGPDTLQRFIVFGQRRPLKPAEGVKPQYHCTAKHPKHTALRLLQAKSLSELKLYVKRILLLSIRLLIFKGLSMGNLEGQGELLNTSSFSSFGFFYINNGGLYPFNRPEWKNTTLYYLIISDWKSQLVLWESQRTKLLIHARERGKCVWEPHWPRLPWHNSSLWQNAPWQFILLQENEGNTVENLL